MSGPPIHKQLEHAFRSRGLRDVCVQRGDGGFWVGRGSRDRLGFIDPDVARHNIRQDTLTAFAAAWIDASGIRHA